VRSFQCTHELRIRAKKRLNNQKLHNHYSAEMKIKEKNTALSRGKNIFRQVKILSCLDILRSIKYETKEGKIRESVRN
jgi:hypothetical protein